MSTICAGMAASMGAFILSSGARKTIRLAELSYDSPGFGGAQATDIKIHADGFYR